MMKNILTITLLTTVLFLIACRETSKEVNADGATTDSIESAGDDIVKTSSTDKDGKKLVLTFNNTKGTTTLDFNGETIELVAQKVASGIWYKNDHYELRGKGNDIELTKD